MTNKINPNGNDFAVVSGRTNPELVKKVAEHLGVDPIFLDTKSWGNGYPRCIRPANVTFQGKDVFIVTSLQYHGIGSPVEELELIHEACGSAATRHLIITWFCTKDDVEHGPGHIPNAPMIAQRIRELGPTSVNLFDPHQSGHMGYFDPIRRRRFYLLRLLIEYARKIGINQIAGADFGSTNRALKVERFLQTGVPFLIAQKVHQHNRENELAIHQSFGQIIGERIGMFDDMALTLSTLAKTAEMLHEMGAKEVFAFAPHFDPTEKTMGNLVRCFNQGLLTAFVTTNSTAIPPEYLSLGQERFIVIDASSFIGDVIRSIIKGESTSPYFDDI